MNVDRRTLEASKALRWVSRALVCGHRDGDRSSMVRGRGVEFADYRPYAPGDDLRLVDWNVYGRLEQMVVRLFHEDRVMGIRIVLDCSSSMAAHHSEKADFGANIAAVLSLVALKHRDTVHFLFAGTQVPTPEVYGHDLRQFPKLLRSIEATEAEGPDCLLDTLQRGQRTGVKDMVVVISDGFWEPERRDVLLKAIAKSGRQATLFHVLSDADRVPQLRDGQVIQDAETGARKTVRWDMTAQRLHAEEFERWSQGIKTRCRRLGVRYLPCPTNRPLLEPLTHGQVLGVSV